MTDKQIIGFYDCVFFDEVEIEKCNGLIIKTTNKKEFTSHRELKKKGETMTDKQIIDGVDVSGCTRYCADNGKCTAFKSQYLCSERNNCYTKRILKKNKTINILKEKLLRKEQECEELKAKCKKYGEINEQETKDYAELKAENKVLTEQLAEMMSQSALLPRFFGLSAEEITQLATKCSQLSKTLTEIKEIAEAHKKDESIWNPYRQLDKILQKISEVEDG